MMDLKAIEDKLLAIACDVVGQEGRAVPDLDAPLMGERSFMRSRHLVEFMLGVEDFADHELGYAFDWASPMVLSSRRSLFRSIRSLAAHLDKLKDAA